MKSFLKYTLATIVGVSIVLIIGSIISIASLSAIVSLQDTEPVIKDKSVLSINLNKQIVDRGEENPFEDLDIPMLNTQTTIGMDDIISAINKAKTNDKIKGIYLKSSMIMAGWSQLYEIREALEDFKESGKFIYAYTEMYSQQSYYLASVADKICVTPEGNVMLHGLSSQRTFYKRALEKLGVEMQIVKVGKFKSAVEPFIREDMSPENRKQTEVYLNSMWNTVASQIATSRGVDVGVVNKIADTNTMFAKVDVLKEANLIDEIIFEDEFLDMLREELGIGATKGIPTCSVGKMKRIPEKREKKGLAKDKIAIIYAEGEIGMEVQGGFGSSEGINGKKIAKEIRVARQDSSIKAIVLRVNSPGGSALASDLMWREVKLSSEVKPTIVSMGNYAASGGYYMSCAANKIVASPVTVTGSIGIFGMIPNAQELLEDKLGFDYDKVNTNTHADFPQINRPMTREERAMMQNMVNKGYQTFIGHVADGRGMRTTYVDTIGQGRVWTGENALEIQLVDQLGTLKDAIEIAKTDAGLDHYRIVKRPKQEDPFEQFLKGAYGSVRSRILMNELGQEGMKHMNAIKRVQSQKGVMARMMYDLEIN